MLSETKFKKVADFYHDDEFTRQMVEKKRLHK